MKEGEGVRVFAYRFSAIRYSLLFSREIHYENLSLEERYPFLTWSASKAFIGWLRHHVCHAQLVLPELPKASNSLFLFDLYDFISLSDHLTRMALLSLDHRTLPEEISFINTGVLSMWKDGKSVYCRIEEESQ